MKARGPMLNLQMQILTISAYEGTCVDACM